jgi:L,D-peptidoglycan transpeptidase YkuD (ErfK/YbiS/YcfS/YnhG family)
MRCALGRAGVTTAKSEGDGATPAGTWPLRRLLVRADRWPQGSTGLPVSTISRDDGWCDDPADAHYNMAVKLPHGASCEEMWRDDHLYDAVVVVGYNDAPPVPGLGSAIFLHLATKDYGPTAGCVALSAADLAEVLSRCGPATSLEIGA